MQKKVSPHAALVRPSPPVEELSVTSEVDGRNLADLRLAPHEPRRCPLDPHVPTSHQAPACPCIRNPGSFSWSRVDQNGSRGNSPAWVTHSLLTNRIRVRGSGPHTGAWDRLLPLGGAGRVREREESRRPVAACGQCVTLTTAPALSLSLDRWRPFHSKVPRAEWTPDIHWARAWA